MALDGAVPDKTEYLLTLKQRYDALKGATERTNCESHWQDVGEVMSPRKIDFVGMRTLGERQMNRVYDSTGIHANELLAAGLHGMATNPASKWFSLRMVTQRVVNEKGAETDLNQDEAVQKYLSDVEEVMWQRIYQPGTNFTTALHETYLDLGAFGTAIMFVGQRDNGGLLFESRSLAECVIAENADGKVDTVFRKTRYTVRQMMQMQRSAGWKVSDEVRKLYEDKKYDDPIDVIHAVFPREEREVGKKDAKNMPFASCYFEHKACHELQMSGYAEFPYLVPRWSKYAGEIYGRSPGMTALPDVKMLQAMNLTYIKTVQKNVDPPIALRDDAVVGAARTIPGGVTYFRGNPSDAMMTFPTSVQGLGYAAEFMESVRNRIRTTFFVDVLQMVTDNEMTATEVMQRTSERMRLLGPLIGRLESELLGPLVDRVFGVLTRAKLMPAAPKIIQDQDFTVEYVSPIATAQKQQAIGGIMQVMQLMSPFGPEVSAQIASKNLDVDKMFRWGWDLFNNDPDLLKSDEAIEDDNAKAKMMQQMQMAQPVTDMAATGAGALRDVAQAAQTGGIDVQQLVGAMARNVQGSPQAQAEIANAADQAGLGQLGDAA
jgi:hypothetical protein